MDHLTLFFNLKKKNLEKKQKNIRGLFKYVKKYYLSLFLKKCPYRSKINNNIFILKKLKFLSNFNFSTLKLKR